MARCSSPRLGYEREPERSIREAMVHYRIALALNPVAAQPYYNPGRLLVKQGDWLCRGITLAVLACYPNDFDAHLMLARSCPIWDGSQKPGNILKPH